MAYAIVKEIVDKFTLQHGEGGLVANCVYRIDGLEADADFLDYISAYTLSLTSSQSTFLDFALHLPTHGGRISIPQRGDLRVTLTKANGSLSTFQNMVCVDSKAKHPGTAKGHVEVTATFAELGLPVTTGGLIVSSYTNIYQFLVSGAINGTTVNAQTSFGYATDGTYGTLLAVYYAGTNSGYDYSADGSLAAHLLSGYTKVEYARVPSLEVMSGVQFQMRELINPANANADLRSPQAKQAKYAGSVNSSAIWGYAAGTLKLRMAVGQMDPLRSMSLLNPDAASGTVTLSTGGTLTAGTKTVLWDVGYIFEHRARGWDEIAVFTDPATGLQPSNIDVPAAGIIAGVDHGNGWLRARPLKRLDFADLNLPDLRAL